MLNWSNIYSIINYILNFLKIFIMTIGIYRLRFNTLEDWPYIGQSSNIEQRYVCHKSELKHGKSNYMLLEAYSITNSYSIIRYYRDMYSIRTNRKRNILY